MGFLYFGLGILFAVLVMLLCAVVFNAGSEYEKKRSSHAIDSVDEHSEVN